jgi:metallophosphoesterase superfamily enzyme
MLMPIADVEHFASSLPVAAGSSMVRILDPLPPLRVLAESPVPTPAVVFWTNLDGGETAVCALPFAEGQEFYHNLLPILQDGRNAIANAINDRASKATTKRILHLSDLHFGDSAADARRHYIKGHLDNLNKRIDCVLITGDLCHTPDSALHRQWTEFRSDVVRILNRRNVITVPGNHDIRTNGIFGKNYEFVFDIGFRSVIIDDELECVFFCFNSAEGGPWARGLITPEQLTTTATQFEEICAERRRGNERDPAKFLKICVLRHHPVAYETVPTTVYDKAIRLITRNEDSLTRLEDADQFLTWCADRGATLIVHGHKHVPHHVQLEISGSDGSTRLIEVVGCGSTTGAERSSLCYDILSVDPSTRSLGISFYHDPSQAGAGFRPQDVAIDTRSLRASW